MDHFHYARRLSIYSYDMNKLKDSNDYVFTEFEENDNFLVARTQNRFSSIMLCAPEDALIVRQFEQFSSEKIMI